MIIRPAELADAAAIAEIYNEAILNTTATFDTEPKSVDDRTEWLQAHDARHPVVVAVVDSRLVGWASLSPWSERAAYDGTAETSFYVSAEFRGRGIGRKLKETIIHEARRLGYHTLIARVAEESVQSIHLNESAGFVHVAAQHAHDQKFREAAERACGGGRVHFDRFVRVAESSGHRVCAGKSTNLAVRIAAPTCGPLKMKKVVATSRY